MAGSASALRQSRDPRDRGLLDELTAMYSNIAALVSHGPGGSSPAE